MDRNDLKSLPTGTHVIYALNFRVGCRRFVYVGKTFKPGVRPFVRHSGRCQKLISSGAGVSYELVKICDDSIDSSKQEALFIGEAQNGQCGIECVNDTSWADGSGFSGMMHGPDARRRMSAAARGRKQSEEHRRKGGDARRGKKRKPHSDEARRKMSAAHAGKVLSEDHRRKAIDQCRVLHERNRGKSRSEETCRRISEAKTGRALSDEHIARLRDAARRQDNIEHCKRMGYAWRGKKRSEETRRRMSEASKRREAERRADKSQHQGSLDV